MTQALVTLVDLTKIYPTVAGPVTALRNVDLPIGPGEFVVLQGPSGSGKSTLLSLIAGLDRPSSGRVLLGGQDLAQLSETQLALLRGQKMGFIFQSFNLIASMTALENVELPARFRRQPPPHTRALATELLKLVGLSHRLHHLPSQLSGGQQQRVALARALINAPVLILGDEPTGNLDSQTGLQVIDLLDQVRRQQGCALVLATHDAAVAARAERIVSLQDGALVQVEVRR